MVWRGAKKIVSLISSIYLSMRAETIKHSWRLFLDGTKAKKTTTHFNSDSCCLSVWFMHYVWHTPVYTVIHAYYIYNRESMRVVAYCISSTISIPTHFILFIIGKREIQDEISNCSYHHCVKCIFIFRETKSIFEKSEWIYFQKKNIPLQN